MFSWEFSNKQDHSPTWYIVAIVVVLVFVAYGILSGLYLLSVAFFLFAGTYLLIENNAHPVLRVTFSDGGFSVGETVYEFKNFRAFALLSVDNVPKVLRFYPSGRLSSTVDIPMTSDVNPIELRNWLSTILTEDADAKYTTTDSMIERMRI